ncbi:MAG: hypothetical protein K0S44_2035 [Bacteroidetes bacterium]|jgi:hypothetical protein|nr:hypothetical protein [Bacteroidota bacterium]
MKGFFYGLPFFNIGFGIITFNEINTSRAEHCINFESDINVNRKKENKNENEYPYTRNIADRIFRHPV